MRIVDPIYRGPGSVAQGGALAVGPAPNDPALCGMASKQRGRRVARSA